MVREPSTDSLISEKRRSSRGVRHGLVVATLSYLAIALVFLVFVYWPYQNEVTRWEQTTVALVELEQDLLDVTREFGYGGFIHEFKNYVLRRDERYWVSALASIDSSREASLELQSSVTRLQLDSDLQPLIDVLEDYRAKVDWVLENRLQAQTMTPNELDDLVRVDDTLAFRALDRVFTESNTLLDQILVTTEQNQKDFINQVLIFFAVTTILYAFAIYFLQRSNKEIRILMEQFQAIHNFSPIGLAIVNKKGQVVSSNRMFVEIFDIPDAHQISSYRVEDFLPRSKRVAHQETREHAMATGADRIMVRRNSAFEGQTLSGERLYLDISVVSLEEQLPDHYMVMVDDITEQQNFKEKSLVDHLTNTYNRRYGESLIEKELERVKRYAHPSSLLLIDIDHFKRVNDEYGHQAGDDLLLAVVDSIQEHIRATDYLARWGGDEFLLLLPETDIQAAEQTAEKLCEYVRQLNTVPGLTITLSVGIAEMKAGQTYKDLFKAVDAALYISKENGRDQVTVLSK